ncbi:PPM-type phosphatase-like domain [Dillenia turbinata]|uniref:protein-serine/threonine phosphatase n=1 Tax=Dillenia turbinata TaxID=194707 RepID=A0AAN8VTI3_9MAGN
MNNNWIFTTQTCFLTGGQNRRFGYGYSSFKGKRASVEDFFETQIAEVEGQMVAFFGVFDGHGGSTTAEYVKNNLFKNLSSHPLTDADYLAEDKGQQKDAGSTASTALLVENRLIVANVGDSRVVACRSGSGLLQELVKAYGVAAKSLILFKKTSRINFACFHSFKMQRVM